jgi:molybdopterin converting factor subunit 1
MQLNVQLFATLANKMGQSKVDIELDDGTTVGDMLKIIAAQYPAIAPLLERSAVAVNLTYVKADHTLCQDDEIALIPPVSGGAP